MDTERINEILDFAIEREYEAAGFYKELQSKVQSDSSIEMLVDFEKMELGHAHKLEKFKKEGIDKFKNKEVSDLKLSDYLVRPELTEKMTFQDVLVVAMKREETAKKLYEALAAESDDLAVRQLFIKLASEEAQHKLLLETLYDDQINWEN